MTKSQIKLDILIGWCFFLFKNQTHKLLDFHTACLVSCMRTAQVILILKCTCSRKVTCSTCVIILFYFFPVWLLHQMHVRVPRGIALSHICQGGVLKRFQRPQEPQLFIRRHVIRPWNQWHVKQCCRENPGSQKHRSRCLVCQRKSQLIEKRKAEAGGNCC